MQNMKKIKQELVEELQEKYNSFEEIAIKLHKMKETDLEHLVIKKMAGLKMMIDHCTSAEEN